MNTAKPRRSTLRRRLVWAVSAVVVVAVVAAALVFEPWKLVVDERVQEAAPAAAATGPTHRGPLSLISGSVCLPNASVSSSMTSMISGAWSVFTATARKPVCRGPCP